MCRACAVCVCVVSCRALCAAFIGALFLEKGLEVVEAFVRVVFLPRLEDMLATRQYLDPKSRLSQRHRSAPPTYTYACASPPPNRSLPMQCPRLTLNSIVLCAGRGRLLSETGPAHMRKFVVGVTVRGRLKGKGSGYTRVSAEQSTPRHRFIHSFMRSFIHLWCWVLLVCTDAANDALSRD